MSKFGYQMNDSLPVRNMNESNTLMGMVGFTGEQILALEKEARKRLEDIKKDFEYNYTDKNKNFLSDDPVNVKNVEKANNVGDIAISTDYSGSLVAPLMNNFKLVTWLMNTPFSATMQRLLRTMSGVYKEPGTGDWNLRLPYTYYTTPPESTEGQCCWVPFDLAKCADVVPLYLLCLRDCETIMDRLINSRRIVGSNESIEYFRRTGESVEQARVRMARTSMAWFTMITIILGTTNNETEILKPFHGLLQVLEDDAVLKINASGYALGAFGGFGCRMALLEATGETVVAVHPLTYEGIKEQVTLDRFGNLPENWTRTGDTYRYRGWRFIIDKLVPVDIENGVGEAWILNGAHVGVAMGSTLMPSGEFVFGNFMTQNNNPDENCAELCDYYYNYGTVGTDNPNYLGVITNIPLGSQCLGTALQGLDDLINITTLVPRI